jgi:hypothetical protein
MGGPALMAQREQSVALARVAAVAAAAFLRQLAVAVAAAVVVVPAAPQGKAVDRVSLY